MAQLRTDPTRTGMLRKQFLKDMLRRMEALRKDILKLVVEEDAFGLTPKPTLAELVGASVANALGTAPEPLRRRVTVLNRWQAQTRPEQLASFRRWLASRSEAYGLTGGDVKGEQWTDKYVQAAYEKGHSRGYDDVKRVQPTEFNAGRKTEWMSGALGAPEAKEKVEFMASRVFDDLKGVNAVMSQQIGRELADGLAQGKNAREIGRALANRVDKIGKVRGATIARTEIIRAHAEGQLDSMERLGVTEVGVEVEWLITADACPICVEMEGVYPIEKARGQIPAHPNCRCAWMPSLPKSLLKDAAREAGLRSIPGLSGGAVRRIQAPPPKGVVSLMDKIRSLIADKPRTTEELMAELGQTKGKINSYMRGQQKLGKAYKNSKGEWTLSPGVQPPPPPVAPPPVAPPPAVVTPVVPPSPPVSPPVAGRTQWKIEKITAKQKREANWVFKGTTGLDSKGRNWSIFIDEKTGFRMEVFDGQGGKPITRYIPRRVPVQPTPPAPVAPPAVVTPPAPPVTPPVPVAPPTVTPPPVSPVIDKSLSLIDQMRQAIELEKGATTARISELTGIPKGKITSYMSGQRRLGKVTKDVNGNWILNKTGKPDKVVKPVRPAVKPSKPAVTKVSEVKAGATDPPKWITAPKDAPTEFAKDIYQELRNLGKGTEMEGLGIQNLDDALKIGQRVRQEIMKDPEISRWMQMLKTNTTPEGTPLPPMTRAAFQRGINEKARQRLRELLREVRSVGNGELKFFRAAGSMSEQELQSANILREAIKEYPDDWAKLLSRHEIKIDLDRRGYFSENAPITRPAKMDGSISAASGPQPMQPTISVSNTMFEQTERVQVAIHELGHAMEWASGKKIQRLEKQFLVRAAHRTQNKKLTTIYKGTSEVGLEDHLVTHYTGRIYNRYEELLEADQVSNFYEVFTTGLDSVLGTRHRGTFYKDEEHWNLIAGLLFGA